MSVSISFDQSVAVPLTAITLGALLEEINVLWSQVYDICEAEVKALAITSHEFHVEFLNFMALVSSECTTGCNFLENIHTELIIAVENKEIDLSNGREIVKDAQNLLDIFSKLNDQNEAIKHRVSDHELYIRQQKRELSKKKLVDTVATQVSHSSRIRKTLFSGIIGVAASEYFLDSMDSKIILGLSAATFTTIGISSAIDVFQSGKIRKLRLIVEALKEKIALLLQSIDELGADISIVVDDFKAYAERTEDCIIRLDNTVGERFQAKGAALIKNTLALIKSLKQIRARAMENSKSIRKIIRLEKAAGVISGEK